MWTRPSKTVDEYLETLVQQGLSQAVVFLWKHEADIGNRRDTKQITSVPS